MTSGREIIQATIAAGKAGHELEGKLFEPETLKFLAGGVEHDSPIEEATDLEHEYGPHGLPGGIAAR